MSMVNTKKRSHTERVKGELEQLRNDVQALEAVFKRLKKNTAVLTVHWSPSTPPDSGRGLSQSGSEWMEIVVEQCRRRRESEALNRRLRSMLGKLVSTVHASEGALAFKFTDAVRYQCSGVGSTAQVLTGFPFPQDFNALYGTELDADMARSLSLRAQAVQLDVGSILKRTGLVHIDSLLSWSQRSHDVSLGVFFEVTSCLPVRYSLEQIREAFARQCPCTDGQIVDVQVGTCLYYSREPGRANCVLLLSWMESTSTNANLPEWSTRRSCTTLR